MNTITPADLGIVIAPHHDGPSYGYYWRIEAPAPVYDWQGPHETIEDAQAAAVRHLLRRAHDGQAADLGQYVAFAADDG